MAQVNYSSSYAMECVQNVVALADAGTVDIQLPDDFHGSLIVQAIDSAGVSYSPAATTFTTVLNLTTKVLTVTNASGAAFTGKYIALFVK
jgi:hypothetical protein